MLETSCIKDLVTLADGEQIVREYHAIEYHGILKEFNGRLALTTKRVIAYSKKKTVLGERQEINYEFLEGVEGIRVVSGYSTSWWLLIGGIGAAVFGIASIVQRFSGWIGILALVIGVMLIIFSFRREFGVEVRSSSSGTGEPINSPVLYAWGLMITKVRGPDADVLMKGLNAMILDIKLRGRALLEDLKCPNPECGYVRRFDEKPPKHCPECGTAWGG